MSVVIRWWFLWVFLGLGLLVGLFSFFEVAWVSQMQYSGFQNIITWREAIASPSIGFGNTLRRVLMAFTRPVITGGWPWQTLGAICAVATVWEGAELVFGHLNNAWFHRFPVGQFSRILDTITSIGVAMKTFRPEFWKFYHKGSFFQKRNNFSTMFQFWRLQTARTPQW